MSVMPDDHGKRSTRRKQRARATGGPSLTLVEGQGGGNGSGDVPRQTLRAAGGGDNRQPPRVNKARLSVILFGLAVLAVISTVFGMMMAVAQDLPSLETTNEFKASKNSILTDNTGKKRLAVLTGNENRILVGSGDISPTIKHAVIAIEDQRFFAHKGVDYQGIARALWQDILRRKAAQGGSTITQQFVKNALLAQTDRSVFQKLKEAALAYQLERKWAKDKILTQYLNTVYFGAGAYGIESAARIYFGWDHPGCEPHCATALDPAEAALLAGMIASPAAYSPIQNPGAALQRRNLVLQQMREQGYISSLELSDFSKRALPPVNKITPPKKISSSPYFTAWVEQQLVDRYGTGATFGGGLKVRTTLDMEFQKAAEAAVARIGGIGPQAALVALDNKTGGVRAMVGGPDFQKQPFNLATQGRRQPGSAFKPFTLVTALEKGISPGRTFVSAPKTIKGSLGDFKVENYEDRYSGSASLATATTVSDNSVYAEVGYKLVGTRAIARTARRMGIRTPVSTNPAMILGGLKVGVTPLEMADSYLTLAHGGSRVSGSLAAYDDGPVAYTKVKGAGIDDENDTNSDRVVSEGVADQATQILRTVVSSGTGRNAQTGDFAAGKTGTTENYVDAWFVGYSDTMTVAVWVGYPTGGRAMETEYRGEPVAGGTYPAEIWRDFMLSVKRIREARTPEKEPETPPPGVAPVAPPADATPSGPEGGEKRSKPKRERAAPERTPPPEQAPPDPAPQEPAPTPTPAPSPTPPPNGGSGGTEGAAGAGPGQP
jgi:penicillin-binding protein 1A